MKTQNEAQVQRRLIPITEVRTVLGGQSRQTIYNLARRGEIKFTHVGRRVFVTQQELDRFIDALESA
jgi:excisionase family DNA binding protein